MFVRCAPTVIESPNLSEACRGVELAAKMCGDVVDRIDLTVSERDVKALVEWAILDMAALTAGEVIDVTPV